MTIQQFVRFRDAGNNRVTPFEINLDEGGITISPLVEGEPAGTIRIAMEDDSVAVHVWRNEDDVDSDPPMTIYALPIIHLDKMDEEDNG